MKWIRDFAQYLSRLPLWLLVPFLIMEGIVVCLIFAWLYLTRSVETVTVPNLVDQPIERVEPTLRERELAYRIHWEQSLKTPRGKILRQIPPPGAQMKENRTLELYVSEGPEYVLVPDIRGKTLLQARNELRRKSSGEEGKAGTVLTLGNMARVFSSRQPEEHIILQQPVPGTRVVRGSQVDVLVSKGSWPRRTVVPALHGQKLSRARESLKKNHLEVGNVHYILQEDSPPSVVLGQSPPAHRIVPRGQSVSLRLNLSEPERQSSPVRYTVIRISPPLSMTEGRLRVKVTDYRGTRVVYDETVAPGREVSFVTSVKGTAEVIIYWNEELYRIRTLEASP